MNNLKETFKELMAASKMSFLRRNKSLESKEFCSVITKELLACETRRRSRKAKDRQSFMLGVEIILADLMVGIDKVPSRWVYRPTGNDMFSNEVVKRVTFRKIISLMQIAGFIEQAKGGNQSNPFYSGKGGSKPFYPGLATRFRVTEHLLTIASNYGVTPNNITHHYLRRLPTNVIRLRATSITQQGRKFKGRQMAVKPSFELDQLSRDIKIINQYLDKQHLENAVFSGYYRTFNLGDQPDFYWNKGGRLSCPGKDNYQELKKQYRLSNIKINNESIAEVDINASYLSIFYGLTGRKLPAKDDLYQVPGLHRTIVKAWITAAFGKGTFPTRWPSNAKAQLVAKGICLNNLTMKQVGQRVCAAIPVLKQLPTSRITWADLMYKESEAIILAMESLRENFNIPAYSMHDGLIVPLSGKDIAANEIMRAFDELGLECRVKIETQA